MNDFIVRINLPLSMVWKKSSSVFLAAVGMLLYVMLSMEASQNRISIFFWKY